jgi:RNA-directed DNA polymerase
MINTKPFQISKQMIWEAWECVERNQGSSGIDRESIEAFGVNLGRNLFKIWNRMSSGTYFPPAVMGVPIPKKSGGQRILGIPTVSDRIAQTVVKMVLEPELEKVFLPDSFGYRPCKSAHSAIEITRKRCWESKYVLEFDIRSLFDNIPWDLLLKAVRHHTNCKWVLLYIERWLQAPIQFNDGKMEARSKGTPQGSVISPILSNLFLHYCFDFWMTRKYSHIKWCRYADDGLIHCKSLKQAEYMKVKLTERLKECGLEIHPEKTKVVYCQKIASEQLNVENKFTFLGFLFKHRTVKNSKDGKLFDGFGPAVSNEAMASMKWKIKHGWKLQTKTFLDLETIANQINPVIRGWIAYYGKFRPSSMVPIYRLINQRLCIWIRQKFKNLASRKTRSHEWLKRVYTENPKLFAHWKMMPVY